MGAAGSGAEWSRTFQVDVPFSKNKYAQVVVRYWAWAVEGLAGSLGALYQNALSLCVYITHHRLVTGRLPLLRCHAGPPWSSVGRPAGVKKGLVLENNHIWSVTIKLLTRSIWAPARQRYLVGLASLTTHQPGHIIKLGWPRAKLSARFSASVRRAIRSSISGRLHRAN